MRWREEEREKREGEEEDKGRRKGGGVRLREKEKRESEGGKGRGGRCDREEKESEKERGRRRYVAKLDKRKKTRTVTRDLQLLLQLHTGSTHAQRSSVRWHTCLHCSKRASTSHCSPPPGHPSHTPALSSLPLPSHHHYCICRHPCLV